MTPTKIVYNKLIDNYLTQMSANYCVYLVRN
jgi:hypothetical protein